MESVFEIRKLVVSLRDEVLIEQWLSRKLTTIERSVYHSELLSRGIDPDSPKANPPMRPRYIPLQLGTPEEIEERESRGFVGKYRASAMAGVGMAISLFPWGEFFAKGGNVLSPTLMFLVGVDIFVFVVASLASYVVGVEYYRKGLKEESISLRSVPFSSLASWFAVWFLLTGFLGTAIYLVTFWKNA